MIKELAPKPGTGFYFPTHKQMKKKRIGKDVKEDEERWKTMTDNKIFINAKAYLCGENCKSNGAYFSVGPIQMNKLLNTGAQCSFSIFQFHLKSTFIPGLVGREWQKPRLTKRNKKWIETFRINWKTITTLLSRTRFLG